MKSWIAPLAVLCVCAAPISFAAEAWPSKPIRFVVPFPPGGGTDAFARIVSPKLTEFLGQPIVVENRSGAQGNIGSAFVAKSAPDGYTILLGHQGALTINPHLYSNPGFDTLRDFVAVTRGTATAFVLAAHPSLPARTMKELVALAKQNPGQLTFASTASGPQLAGELFKLQTGTNLIHVPYKGAGPAVIDLLAGNVVLMFANPTSVVPHVKTGKLRAIAVLGDKRNDALPNAPTAIEAGYPELGTVLEWYGVVAPAAMPPEIIARLHGAILKALHAPEVLDRMNALGQTIAPIGPGEFAKQIHTDFERWGKVVKAAGVKVD